jgi:hypothetical protein
MARTIGKIQADIISAKNAQPELAGLTSTSQTAIWLLWTYVIAFAMWTLEVLFDLHKAEVKALIDNDKAHTRNWYVKKALLFQYGVALPADTDVYPTTTAAALIVTKAAAQEVVVGPVAYLRIKVAKGNAPLVPLDATPGSELDELTNYLARVKDAGVRLQVTTGAGDTLQLAVTINYDPLVLNSNLERLDGAALTPVQDAISGYLLNMSATNFNGALVLNKLVDRVLTVEGINMFTVGVATGTYASTTTTFIDRYSPDAGYMVNDDAYLVTNWVVTAGEPV